jgi:alkylation response protein AidB-like acyl-CoA dehydrogenase
MFDLIPSDEQAMIADSVRQLLADELPLERLRPNAKPIDAARIRKEMAALGWFGIGIAADMGGMGLGLAEEMLVQRLCGQYLATTSVLGTVLAAHVAAEAGDGPLLGELISGQRSAALAIVVGGDVLVFDWSPGDLLFVWDEKSASLFPSEAFESPVAEKCLDDSLTLHRGTLGNARHRIAAQQAPIGLRANVLLAARQAGLAEQACALAVEYAKVREQFGKPIGAFQAIKHRCADMALRAEGAAHLVAFACLKLDADAPDAVLQVAAAKLKAGHAAHEGARAAIQIHGGIGFHAECHAHWFMKRAHVYDRLGGNMDAQAQRVFREPSPLW